MGSYYMESTQINYRRDETLKTVDQKLQELSETSAIDTDIAPVFKSTNTYAPGDMVYYRNKLYVFNVEHTGAWAAGDVTATDVTTEVSSLRSGLTNVNVALSVPENSGKNVLPLTLANLKSVNTTGTWADNVYTLNGVDFTVNIDSNGRVSGITANGTASANTNFFFVINSPNIYSGYILNGSVGGNSNSYYIALSLNSSPWTTNTCYNSDTTITIPKTATIESYIRIANGYEANNVTFYPMIRSAIITDPTYAPYIPSVESRIEAVENTPVSVEGYSGVTINARDVACHGKVVFGSVVFKTTIAANTWGNAFIMSIHPKNEVYAPVIDASNGNYVGMAKFYTNGGVMIYLKTAVDTNEVLSVNFNYVSA